MMRAETRIGGRSIPVVPSLVAAAIVGLVLGTWLGLYGPGAPTSASGSLPTSTASPAPNATATNTANPAVSPTRAPTSTPASSPVASPSSAPAAPGTVLEVRGDGTFVSEPFTVSTGWQIYWQVEGGEFAVTLVGDEDYGTIIEEPGPASGVTSPVPTGTLSLEVRSTGPWSITIEQP